jgi:GH18 family chitinase
VQEFREEFDKFGLLLTAPVGVTRDRIERSYDLPAVSQYLHYMFALCYGYYSTTNSPTEPNAPLYPRYDDDELNVVRIHEVLCKLVLYKPFCLCQSMLL